MLRVAQVTATMLPTEILLACLVAALIVVLAPELDCILAIRRGMSQGRAAAARSSMAAALGTALQLPDLLSLQRDSQS